VHPHRCQSGAVDVEAQPVHRDRTQRVGPCENVGGGAVQRCAARVFGLVGVVVLTQRLLLIALEIPLGVTVVLADVAPWPVAGNVVDP
jgi:hypothetical protein